MFLTQSSASSVLTLRCSLYVLLAYFTQASVVHADNVPNILILYADDLGYGDLSCQNANSKIPTKHLDRLASQGLRCTDGHSSSGICTPSRYALLTGRYHWRDFHGIVGPLGNSVFKSDQLTLPEMLKQKGYDTACIGKWHLGWNWDAIRTSDDKKSFQPDAFDWSKPVPDGPLAHGFDHYFGDSVINFPPYAWINDDRLVQPPTMLMNTSLWKPIKEGGWECRPGPMAEDWDPYDVLPTLADAGVRYLEKRKRKQSPFFLYFAFPCPHAPIIPNDDFDGTSQAGPYGDFVVETDAVVGRLLDAIDRNGIAENTLVIFTADNGPEKYAYARDKQYHHWSSQPFRGLKRDIYEGGHHVPLIVRWPQEIPAGVQTDALISQVDLMATIAAIVEYPLPENAAHDSYNQLPVLKTNVREVRKQHVHNTRSNSYAMRSEQWLLINAKSGYVSNVDPSWLSRRQYPKDSLEPVELYDLSQDQGQRNNLATTYPHVVQELQQQLFRIQKRGSSAPRLAP